MNIILKKTLGLVIVIGLATSLSAQKMNYGIKAGSNFAVQSETGDLNNNDDIKIGFHAGVFGNISLAKNFKLQTEVNYDQKGSYSDNITNTYDYVTVPVLAKLSLGKSIKTPLEFNIYAGPYVGFLIKAETENSDLEGSQVVDNEEETESSEIGVVGGFGISYPINKSKIFLDFRLGLGLNAYDKTDDSLRNKYFGVNLGLEF